MKKKIYILLTIVLTLELSIMLHGLIEIWYINYALAKGIILDNTLFLGKFYCVLPWWLQYGLLIMAVIGGYYLGQCWWRIVYIEKRHWRFKNKV
ncbi:MAG: hypothetical protein NTW06_03050 [Candidatus Falkowbacteria bacterium]|nr:hypothetical protein [Candidatus Falkowbacteria bacterium]